MANIIDSLSNVVSVTNSKADQLTTLAKGVLCLPAILRGSVDSSESILKGILAGATQTIASLSNTVRTLITNTIQDQVNRLTGAATSVVNTIQGALASIAATYETVNVIISNIKSKVSDVRSFISDKDNCNFAAATLARCITNQALNSVNAKAVVSISKGTSSVAGITDNIVTDITSSTGIVNNFINKQAVQINRANKLVGASSVF